MGRKEFYFLGFLAVLVFIVGCSAEIESNNDFLDKSDVLEEEKIMDKESKKIVSNYGESIESIEDDYQSIYINNLKLSGSQIKELEEIYGAAPLPGKYWYDSLSGSYGVMHGSSLGVILPGHEFGSLPADASNGNTGVFINGRELPEADLQFLEWLFNTQGVPGRYWQNAHGGIGVEGDSTPLLNMYLSYAQKGSYSGSGSSGSKDNYWAGNFGSYGNEQNGFGYVMVDGASVTYGG